MTQGLGLRALVWFSEKRLTAQPALVLFLYAREPQPCSANHPWRSGSHRKQQGFFAIVQYNNMKEKWSTCFHARLTSES